MGLAVERLPLTLRWKKLYISGRSNDNDNLLGIDYGSSHIVALQRSSERRKQSKEKNGTSRFLSLPMSEPPLHCGWYAKKTAQVLKAIVKPD